MRLLLFSLLALVELGVSIGPLPSGEQRCVGYEFDLDRLQSISNAQSENFGGGKSYKLRLSSNNEKAKNCRLRLVEKSNGVPIYGAETVATLADCSSSESALAEQIGQQGFNALIYQDVTGKTFSSINVRRGYQPTYSSEEVRASLVEQYLIQEGGNMKQIEDPELYIFVTTQEDFLAYFAKLVVKDGDSETKVIQVIVDAHDLSVLSSCITSTSPDAPSRRRLRQDDTPENEGRQLQSLCSTCATTPTIASFAGTTTTGPINSLYLNDAGKLATLTNATLSTGGTILTPYLVSSLNYLGTYHCFSGTASCKMVELPTACSDALSDVHYGAVETLKYAKSELNIAGGLSTSSATPVAVTAFAHYDQNLCNAFYFQNEIAFGDCDCSQWSPLVAMDVVAHELAHGFTEKSSGLQYRGQSGGLNEGYSDIFGTVMEFYINDSMDTPDFTIGEALQGSFGVLRYMEDPPLDGRGSIGNVCDYTTGLGVHFSSGVLNKAFVFAARACAADACSSSLSECAQLMGNLFFYTNLNRLTTFSGYLDSATETCNAVTPFFTETTPTTSCTSAQAKSFALTGWSAVGVTIDQASCAATSTSGCTIQSDPCSCFSNVATVPVQDKGPTPMENLVPGDQVLTSSGYQTMYALVHQNSEQQQSADFLQIYTDKNPGKPLEITGGHMVAVADKIYPVPALAVRPGDVLQSSEWPKEGMRVTKIKTVHRTGLYAPMTTDGTVVVDGVVASCYVALAQNQGEYLELQGGISSGLSQQLFAHMSLSPVRMACMGISMKICQAYDEDGMAYFARAGFALVDFWYAQALPVQILLLALFVLVWGFLFAIESMFGPKLSVLVISGLIMTAAVMRGLHQFRVTADGKKKKTE